MYISAHALLWLSSFSLVGLFFARKNACWYERRYSVRSVFVRSATYPADTTRRAVLSVYVDNHQQMIES